MNVLPLQTIFDRVQTLAWTEHFNQTHLIWACYQCTLGINVIWRQLAWPATTICHFNRRKTVQNMKNRLPTLMLYKLLFALKRGGRVKWICAFANLVFRFPCSHSAWTSVRRAALQHKQAERLQPTLSAQRTIMNSFSSVAEPWKKRFTCQSSSSKLKEKVPLFLLTDWKSSKEKFIFHWKNGEEAV